MDSTAHGRWRALLRALFDIDLPSRRYRVVPLDRTRLARLPDPNLAARRSLPGLCAQAAPARVGGGLIMQRPSLFRDVRTALENNIHQLVREIFPRGRREGAEYRVGSIAGEPGSSLAVHLGPDEPGIWCDFAIGLCGNVLDLIAAVLFSGNKRRALVWALAWLAARGSAGAPSDHFRHRGGYCSDGQRNAEARARAALKIFIGGTDRLVESPGERYLRCRGIDLESFPQPPSSLRFHPGLWHTESGRHWPALIAAITNIEGHLVAVHRTFLEPDGSGKASLKIRRRRWVLIAAPPLNCGGVQATGR